MAVQWGLVCTVVGEGFANYGITTDPSVFPAKVNCTLITDLDDSTFECNIPVNVANGLIFAGLWWWLALAATPLTTAGIIAALVMPCCWRSLAVCFPFCRTVTYGQFVFLRRIRDNVDGTVYSGAIDRIEAKEEEEGPGRMGPGPPLLLV